jgi:hypothetical protein
MYNRIKHREGGRPGEPLELRERGVEPKSRERMIQGSFFKLGFLPLVLTSFPGYEPPGISVSRQANMKKYP